MPGSTEDDELRSVLCRIRGSPGEESAWRRLYELMWPFVVAIAFRFLGDARDLAEDVGQEVFLRLARYGRLERFSDPREFRNYLRAISRNVARNYLRSLRSPAPAQELSLPPDQESRLLADELQRQAFAGISPDDRRLLLLLLEGRTIAEAGKQLSIPYGTAAVRIYRLRRKLQKNSGPSL